MASVNKWIGIGNLGKDPETRYSADGAAITNISIACTESYKDKSGQKQEKTEWIKVSFFGKIAEIAGQYLKKGSSVYIEGKIQTRKWQNKEGVDQYTTEIVASSLQMLGAKGEASKTDSDDDGFSTAPPKKTRPKTSSNNIADMDDDVPF